MGFFFQDNPVITSSNLLEAFRGRDIQVAFTYTPPDGESRATLTITAALEGDNLDASVPVSTLTFNTSTGAILATWSEITTSPLLSKRTYEARFTRTDAAGNSRVFYIRPVKMR